MLYSVRLYLSGFATVLFLQLFTKLYAHACTELYVRGFFFFKNCTNTSRALAPLCVCVLEGHSFPARRSIARRGVALRGEIQSAEPPQDHLAWPAAARSRGGRLLHAAFLHLRGLLRRLEQYRIIGDGTVCPPLPPRPPDLDQSCRVPFFATGRAAAPGQRNARSSSS